MNPLYFVLLFLPFTSLSQQVNLITSLQDSLNETSGLLFINNTLITHNDSGGEAALYEIDTLTGGIARKVTIENASNIDWEDLCHDDTHIFIADFGNNAGSRTNLRVFRVSISDFFNTPNDTIYADTILFNYADQSDFTPPSLSTNFDAEAIISWNDSLYIFTKNWGNLRTNIYSMPKIPGNYSLPRIDSINTQGLVTGATFNALSNTLILSGYAFNDPFVTEISGFTTSQFSTATINRTSIQLPANFSYQLEGIIPISNSKYYISTETSFSGISGLFRLDLAASNTISTIENPSFLIYPNPTSDYLNVDCPIETQLEIYTISGKLILSASEKQLKFSSLPSGMYVVIIKDAAGKIIGQEKVMFH